MDWVSSLVGGAIGCAASIGALTAEKLWDRVGHLRIFYVIRSGKDPINTFGASLARKAPHLLFPLPLKCKTPPTPHV